MREVECPFPSTHLGDLGDSNRNNLSWPGIGRLTLQAIANRKYYLVQGCILAIGLTYVGVKFLTDLLYSAVNSSIRE